MRGFAAIGAAAACVLLLALFAPRAEAQAGQSVRDEEARVVYEAGVLAYEGGHFAEALEHFQRSYELSGRKALLYNIATAAERAREDALAVESYEAFLEAQPQTSLRQRVETRIGELRARLAREEARQAAVAEELRRAAAVEEAREAEAGELEARDLEARAVAEAAPRELSPSGPGPALVLGAGAAVAAAGVVVLALGLADRAAVESPSPGEDHWRDDLARRYERGPALIKAGLVALPVGLAAVAAGTVWTIKRSSGATDDGQLELGVSLGGASLSGRF